MSSPQSQATRLFARVLGPYLVISMALHAARSSDMQALLSGYESNAVLPWVVGTFALLFGLFVLGLQQEWRNAAAIIIGVLGVTTLLEGIVLMGFPDLYMSFARSFSGSISFLVSAVVVGAIGLYLTYVGWRPGD
jgi:hypothetical protein